MSAENSLTDALEESSHPFARPSISGGFLLGVLNRLI
jgi:hypothetical protein